VRALRRIAEEEIVLVILLGGFAAIFLAILPPHVLVADTWLTLASGREVVENGLPSRDEVTVLSLGRVWTDQQWGAQVLFYGAHALAGLPLVTLVAAACVVGAFVVAAAAARSLGASPLAVVLVFFPVIAAAPWAWTVRAQLPALPLYVGVLWLLAAEARRPTRRIYLLLPLLLIWANLHGSVVLGALFAMTLGVIEILRRRKVELRSVLLLALPPLFVLLTPYGPVATARYYHLLLVDPPFDRLVTEWMWSDPDSNTVVFYTLSLIALLLVVWGRRRLTAFDVTVLAVTFVGAVNAIRGIAWFAMACMVLLPVAIGGLAKQRGAVRRGVNRGLATGAAALVAAAAVGGFVHDRDWFVRNWPEPAVGAVRSSLAASNTRVFATSRYADWLLWRIPELRGRLAWDVRFELYSRQTFERIVRFRGEQGDDWKSLADGYEVVVLETDQKPSHIPDFLAEPATRAIYRDDRITVVVRRPARS
jgi:hypothetical protein